MRKLTAALMAGLLAFSLVGCGSSTSDKKTSEKASSSSKQTSEKEENITCDLTVWSPAEDQSPDYGEWLQTQCKAFAAEHPNWKINFKYGVTPEGDAAKVITQDPEAAADVFMMTNDQLTNLLPIKAVARIGGETETYVKETNSQPIVDSLTVDGALYGVPFTSNTWFMYYDKSVFSEDDIKSFDTMLEKGKVSFPLSNSWYIQAFYAGNGCTLFGDGTDEAAGIDFGGDKAAAVTDYLVDLVANPNFINDADGAGIAGLRDGSVNAIFSGTWDAESVKEALGHNMGVAALPTFNLDGTDCQMKSFIGSKAIGVNPNAENMQVAMALAAYLAGEDAQKDHYDMRNILPTNTNLAVDDDFATAVADVMISTSIMQPLVSEMGNYWSPAENMGKALVAGEITHDNAAEKTEDMNTAMNTDVAQ